MFLLAMALAATVGPQNGTHKVIVGRSTYRVSVHNGNVEVANKGLFVMKTVDVQDAMHSAVEQATGCKLTDELWLGNVLEGKLACDPSPTPPPGS